MLPKPRTATHNPAIQRVRANMPPMAGSGEWSKDASHPRLILPDAGDASRVRHLLWGNDRNAAREGILSQDINVFSIEVPLAFSHSPMGLAASLP